MRIIHCTQKLLKELGNSPLQSTDEITNTEGLGNWYANIIWLDRKKCLMFTNGKTLYTFLVPNILKKNLKNFDDLFFINLSYNLQAEGFSLEVVGKVMQEYQETGFAKTASRHILGSMNELAFHYEIFVDMKEGLGNIKILEINMQINETLMKKINYFRPIEALRKNLL